MVSPTNQSDVSDTYCTSSHSTSLKVFGEGEWKVKQHGKERRRIRRKLHLTVDVNTHQIIRPPVDLSLNNVTDAEAFPGLIRQTHRKIRSAGRTGQVAEALVMAHALSKMTKTGMPESVRIA